MGRGCSNWVLDPKRLKSYILNNMRLFTYFCIVFIFYGTSNYWVHADTGSKTSPKLEELQKFEIPETEYKESGMGIVTFPPNSENSKGYHKHSGPEVVYVLEGDIIIKRDGVSEKTYHTGDSWANARWCLS